MGLEIIVGGYASFGFLTFAVFAIAAPTIIAQSYLYSETRKSH